MRAVARGIDVLLSTSGTLRRANRAGQSWFRLKFSPSVAKSKGNVRSACLLSRCRRNAVAAADAIVGAVSHKQERNQKMNSQLRKFYGLASAFILAGALAGCATYGKCGVEGCAAG